MFLSKCGIQTIEKENVFLLSQSCVLNFLFSVIMERSKNDASEVKMFSFLSCNSEGCIFLKFLSNSRRFLMDHKASIKWKTLLKRRVWRKSLFLASNSDLFSYYKNRFTIKSAASKPISNLSKGQITKIKKSNRQEEH